MEQSSQEVVKKTGSKWARIHWMEVNLLVMNRARGDSSAPQAAVEAKKP